MSGFRSLPRGLGALFFAGVFVTGCSETPGNEVGSGGGGGGAAAGSPGSAGAENGGPTGGTSGAGGAGPSGGGAAGSSEGGAPGSSGGPSGAGQGAVAGSPSGGVGGASGSGGGGSEDAAFCKTALTSAAEQYAGFRAAYTDPTRVPRSAKGDAVRLVNTSDWTSGFVAGTFWYLFEHTGDAGFRGAAETWTQALESQSLRTDTHDVGFVIQNSYGHGLRLTQNTAYAPVVQRAATSLRSRFNATVGAIRSWSFGSWTYPVIIDNMMNLELLFNATELGGTSESATIAVTHALTTRANHFRADASSYHVVDYDPTTGAVIRKQTNQGLNDASAWARGQAWGLYGYTMVSRETGDARFLEQARAIADFYTQSPRMPTDCVPYFDFDAPTLDAVPDHRDASAGAIAASGLLELSGLTSGEASARYRAFALCALRSLASPAYRAAPGTNAHFLLQHSVGNYPINDEIDVAINYADYYYVEGLMRCAALD